MLGRSDLLPPDMEPDPEATYVVDRRRAVRQADEQGRAKSYLTAANACHIVLVEVDPRHGHGRDPDGYWIADDCGTRLNPATVEGHDAGRRRTGRRRRAARGIRLRRRRASSLATTFMDYLIPTIQRRRP